VARERVPLVLIQRQLGQSHLGITSIYLEGIDSSEIINTVCTAVPHPYSRQAPDSDGGPVQPAYGRITA
jgi:hypothetical protein